MKIYSPPSEIGPEPRWNTLRYEELRKREDKWLAKLRKWCKDRNPDQQFVGEEVRFPHADGYARYMVLSRTELIWIPLGDAWQFPYIDRLIWGDIRDHIIRNQKLDKLFSGKPKKKGMNEKKARHSEDFAKG